ncbi:MAG: tetratricopeptide repeat protein [Desulfurivibrionaceae bacterium]|nr:tetratricopeptide repeat protein [Desulfurivibrionaceae bacterium]
MMNQPQHTPAGRPQAPSGPGRLCRAFALVMLVAPFVLLPGLSEFANRPQAAWLQITTFLLLTLFFLRAYRNKEEAAIRTHPLLLPLAALLLWSFVGLSYAVNPYEVIKRFLHLLAAGAAFFLALQLFFSPARAKILLWALALAGLGVALIGMGQHLFRLSLIPQIVPPAATFANKNMAAHFVVLSMPAAITLFLVERKRFVYLLSITLALQTTFLVYAQTRASWLALVAQLALIALFFLLFHKSNSLLCLTKRQKKGILLGLVMVAGLIGLGEGGSFSGYGNIVSRVAQSQADVKEPGRQVRFALWLNTLAMARDHLAVGVGLGNFKNHYPRYHDAVLTDQSFSVARQAAHTHNDLFQGLAELGLVGLGLFSWLVLQTASTARLSLQGEDGEQQIIAALALTGLLAFLVVALFSFPMACSLPPFMAALYLGLLAARAPQAGDCRISAVKILAYSALAGGLCLMAGLSSYNELKADHYLARFIKLENRQQWPEAIRVGRKMVRAQPLRHQLLTYLGRAYMQSGNLRQAERAFKVSLKRDPLDINAMTNLGAVYLQGGRYQEAQAISEEALAIFPANWAACSNIGSALLQQGRYSEARDSFARAAAMKGASKQVWYNLGEARRKEGDLEGAVQAFTQALAREPGWQKAAEALSEVKALSR